MYGCETWFLIIREEHREGVLRGIFGPERLERNAVCSLEHILLGH
jgi:hypothetical protein